MEAENVFMMPTKAATARTLRAVAVSGGMCKPYTIHENEDESNMEHNEVDGGGRKLGIDQMQNSARLQELAKEGVNKRRDQNRVQNRYGANEHDRKHH